MSALDIVKILVALLTYGALTPFLAALFHRFPKWRLLGVSYLLWCTAVNPHWFTFVLQNQPGYRGLVRGFEFNMAEVMSLALILSGLAARVRLNLAILAATSIWCGYVAISTVSVVNAVDLSYFFMAFWRYSKCLFYLLAVFLSIRNARDLLHCALILLVLLLFQTGLALDDRYRLGRVRVSAGFEHSNPLGIWSYMCATPLIGLAATRALGWRSMLLILAAVVGASITIVLTQARGSILFFSLACAITLAPRLVFHFNWKLVAFLCLLSGSLGLVVLKGRDSIERRVESARLNEGIPDFRKVLDQQAASMLADYPLGVGWNNYAVVNSQPAGPRYSRFIEDYHGAMGDNLEAMDFTHNPVTENLYWVILAETGYLGMLAYASFMICSLLLAARAAWLWRDHLCGGFLLGLLAALISVYLHSYFERILVQPKNLILWFTFIAIAARFNQRDSVP